MIILQGQQLCGYQCRQRKTETTCCTCPLRTGKPRV